MSTQQSFATTLVENVDYRRLLWAGPLAVIAAVAANLIIRTILVSVLQASTFMPYQFVSIISLTAVGVTLGVIAFAVVGRLSKRPISTFRTVAIIALLVSFVPDILLLVGRPFPGINLLTILGLMLMHVVAAATCVFVLTGLARKSE